MSSSTERRLQKEINAYINLKGKRPELILINTNDKDYAVYEYREFLEGLLKDINLNPVYSEVNN